MAVRISMGYCEDPGYPPPNTVTRAIAEFMAMLMNESRGLCSPCETCRQMATDICRRLLPVAEVLVVRTLNTDDRGRFYDLQT